MSRHNHLFYPPPLPRQQQLEDGQVLVAAGLPVTISGAEFPGDPNGHLGPFKSSGGNFFVVADTSTAGEIAAFKAIDPTDSFSEVDNANRPSLGSFTIKTIDAYQDNDTLHIVTAYHDSVGSGLSHYHYHTFDMATDSWSIVSEQIGSGFDTSSTNAFAWMAGTRSDGDVIVLYQGAFEDIGGVEYARVDYARRESAVWTTGISVDNGGEVDWWACGGIMGASDRAHFFFVDITASFALYSRTLSSGNVLESFPAAGDATAGGNLSSAAPIAYDDGGVTKIRAPYRDSDNTASIAELDSTSDSPGAFTSTTGVSDVTIRANSNSNMLAMANNNTHQHLLYVDASTADLWRDKNTGSGWGTDVEVEDGVTIEGISSNVYDRSGPKLAYVFQDDGVFKYNEVALAVAPLTDAISEGATTGDTEALKATFATAISQGATAGEVLELALTAATQISEGAAAGDSMVALYKALVSVSEGVEAGDSMVAAFKAITGIDEGALGGETVSAKATFRVALEEV